MTAMPEKTTKRQDCCEGDELTAQRDSCDIDGRTPRGGAILHDIDADGSGLDAKAHPGSGSLPLVLGTDASTSTSAASAADGRHGDDRDRVDLVGIAEDPLHRQSILHCIKLRQRARKSLIAHPVLPMMWWRVDLYAGFCPGGAADQPKRQETCAEQRKWFSLFVVVCR